jgi:ABC-type uncharacterized transport system permease subunit
LKSALRLPKRALTPSANDHAGVRGNEDDPRRGLRFFRRRLGLLLPRDTGNWRAFQFGGGQGAFWVMLALAAACVLVNVGILNAPLGYYLRTIRDNEKAAQAIGSTTSAMCDFMACLQQW